MNNGWSKDTIHCDRKFDQWQFARSFPADESLLVAGEKGRRSDSGAKRRQTLLFQQNKNNEAIQLEEMRE